MTEFRVEVVKISEIRKHPNADSLSVTTVYDDYPVIVRTGEFRTGDVAVYVPVDSMVPTDRPEFDWLAKEAKASGYARIRAKKLRGIFSMGLLVPCSQNLVPGTDMQEALGIEKYETPSEKEDTRVKHKTERKSRRSETIVFDRTVRGIATAASLVFAYALWQWFHDILLSSLAFLLTWLFCEVEIASNRHRNKKPNVPVYDIEGYRKHKNAFVDGEEVWLSEKIHGMNARFVHTGHKFFIGSRTMFRSDKNDVWHKIAERYKLEEKLAKYPGLVLFGEIYGHVQDLNYDVPLDEQVRFAAFDMMDLKTRQYLDAADFYAKCKELDIPVVPFLYRGPWHKGLVGMAEGESTIAKHVREGFVCKPMKEATHPGLGRKILKLAGEGYHLRKTSE